MNSNVELFNKRTGRPLATTTYKGKTYAVVEKDDMGDSFFIRVSNRTWNRQLAVVSIDGCSVMDGKTASKDDGGYVLDRFEHYDILGWRRGNDAVAEFEFTALERSYASLTDRPNNVGVVGVWFYKERVLRKPKSRPTYKVVNINHTERHLSIDEDCEYSRGVGTGFGNEVESRVQTTTFDRASNPTLVKVYYYTREQLRDWGVPLPPQSSNHPNPFPADDNKGPFTPAP